MSAIRESVVACSRCRFAGLYGGGIFDRCRYRLGDRRWWGVHFLTCIECGVAHCYGQDDWHGDHSDLFAQPGPLQLSKVTVQLGGGGMLNPRYAEADILRVQPWHPCGQARRPGGAGPDERAAVWLSDWYRCGACGRATLADWFRWDVPGCLPCPVCRLGQLARSEATVG